MPGFPSPLPQPPSGYFIRSLQVESVWRCQELAVFYRMNMRSKRREYFVSFFECDLGGILSVSLPVQQSDRGQGVRRLRLHSGM